MKREKQVREIKLRRELIRRECLKSLAVFTRKFWPIIEPGQVYVDGRHIHTICEHLEAAARFELNELIMNLPPRHMKLLSDDTPIATPHGFRNHGDLKPGDFVFHPSGKPIKVVAVAPKDIADYEIEFSNGEKIKCNGEHLWTVYDRHAGKTKTLRTLDIVNSTPGRGRCRYQLPDVKPLQFKTTAKFDLPPYFLGAWLGDGTATKCCLTLSPNDVAIVRKVERQGLTVSTKCPHPTSNAVTYYFAKSAVLAKLRDLNILGNKRIPFSYLHSNCSDRLELLAGLIDTDGHVGSDGRVRIANSNEALIQDIFDLASSLGFRPYVSKSETPDYGSYRGGKPHFQIGFNPTLPIPTVLARKQVRKFDHVRRAIGIKEVRKLPKPEPGNCIQVDSRDGLYLAGRKLIPTHNSILVNVMFPAWIWAHEEWAARRFMSASYSMRNSVRDSVKMRNIIESPEYMGLFKPAWRLSDDQNQKLKFENTKTGFRFSTSVGGAVTGEGADYLMVDDPLNSIDANSELIRDDANAWWDVSFSTRANNPQDHCKILIMQRLHENDLTGHLMNKAVRPAKRAHLIFPARYDKAICAKSFSILPIRETRKVEGELLWPERFDASTINQLAADLDSLGLGQSHAQLQQDPKPKSGGLFKREWWKRYDKAPSNIFEMVMFVDAAQKPGITHDWSVFATWARCAEGYFLIDLWREKVETPILEAKLRAKYLLLKPDAVVIEDKSAGSSLIQYAVRLEDPLMPIIPYVPTRDKEVRASAATPTTEAGKCFLPNRPIFGVDEFGNQIDLIEAFIAEHERFPMGAHDDMVDTTSMAVHYFSKRIPISPRIRSL